MFNKWSDQSGVWACIESELEMLFYYSTRGGAASEMVKWKMGLSCRSLTAVLGKQVNFGLEISMNDTNFRTFTVQN